MKCLQSWPVKLWQNINERERNIDRYRTFFFVSSVEMIDETKKLMAFNKMTTLNERMMMMLNPNFKNGKQKLHIFVIQSSIYNK